MNVRKCNRYSLFFEGGIEFSLLFLLSRVSGSESEILLGIPYANQLTAALQQM